MNQEKIGKFIAQSRKNKKLTQSELAEKLGVTEKSISNWENGRNMPDYSFLNDLCDVLNISINELFAGEKISDGEYKNKADENLMIALENSSFSLQEKIDYFKNKWKKDNRFGLTLGMIIIIVIIGLGFRYGAEYALLGSIIGFAFSLYEHNRMMKYIKNNAYKKIEK